MKKIVENSPTGQVTQDEFNALTRRYDWFQSYDSNQQSAAIAKAQDEQNNTNLYEESVRSLERTLVDDAATYGFELSAEDARFLAEQSRFNGWDEAQTKQALSAQLQKAAGSGSDLTGVAGNAENALLDWASRNGLSLSRESVAKYVARMTFNRQSLEDVKADLRRTYLAGSYPAWADKINQGYDPADIFEPYVNDIRQVLEDDNIGLSDPLMQSITQRVGADGKPVATPLYEARQMARQDARWQKTDNAYATYANVAQNLLRTFGF